MPSTTPDRRREPAVCFLAVVLLAGSVACQPVGDPESMGEAEETQEEPAVDGDRPAGLDQLLAETDAVAAEWQEDTRPVEVLVRLEEDGQVRKARVTYLAADADRFLMVDVGKAATTEERPTLDTLGLPPVSEEAVAAVPEFPEDAMDPEELAETAAPLLDECGFEPAVDTLLYSSGAPAAWDGEVWADDLEWTATATADGGGAVVLRPQEASPARDDPCVPPA